MRRDDLVAAIIRDLEGYIGIHESDGPNRSPTIDSINKFMKLPMGSAYCLSGLWNSLDNVAKIYEAKSIDLPKTGHCMTFANQVKPFYRTMSPQPGDWAIYQMGDTALGHAACVRKIIKDDIATIEFNTMGPPKKKSGSEEIVREGDGCHYKTRPKLGHGNMKLVTFVRVIDALIFPRGFLT